MGNFAQYKNVEGFASQHALTEDVLRDSVLSTRVKDGSHVAVVTDAKVKEAGPEKDNAGKISIELTYKILKNPEDPTSINPMASVRDYIPYPVARGKYTPSTLDVNSAGQIMAVFAGDDLPPAPRRIDGVWTLNGERIDESQRLAATMALNAEATDMMRGLLFEPGPDGTETLKAQLDLSAFVSRVVFVAVAAKPGSDFVNVKWRSLDCPDGFEPETEAMIRVGHELLPPKVTETPDNFAKPVAKSTTKAKAKK